MEGYPFTLRNKGIMEPVVGQKGVSCTIYLIQWSLCYTAVHGLCRELSNSTAFLEKLITPQLVRNDLPLVEFQGSLPCSQELTTGSPKSQILFVRFQVLTALNM
jgi:hypothetical protein